MYEFLKKVPLFEDLPDEDLFQLCQKVETVKIQAGANLFDEGTMGDRAYVIQEGQLEVLKSSGAQDVLLAVREPGEVIGELALLENRPRMATVRARLDSTLLAIHQDQLADLITTSPSAARSLFYTVLNRWQSTNSLLRQSEKMAQLGSLTAGVAHELNNPAAAVKRGASHLESSLERMTTTYVALIQLDLTEEQQAAWQRLTHRAQVRASQPSNLTAAERSDREYELEMWLEEQGVDDAWELAPILVSLDLDAAERSELARHYSAASLRAILSWVDTYHATANLLAELRQGAARISEIVKALKTYSYQDQGPLQRVDVHEGIDSTLIILRHKLKTGIAVHRDYAPDLPQINAYGSELNQVWTNLIDNAADALEGQGEIWLRTRLEDDWVVVEVEDNGPGIPPEVERRMFEPFFTTKPPGVGTGLGLDISYNIVVHQHRGDISVDTEPGRTRIEVRLPVNLEGDSGPEQDGRTADTASPDQPA